MGGTGSGRKSGNRGFSGREGSGFSIREDLSNYSLSNPDADFFLFNKERAKELNEWERHHAKEAERIARVQELGLDNIPVDPKDFYRYIGCPILDNNNERVGNLADYQWEVWYSVFDHRYTVVVKSQKVGITTAVLLADLQLALLPKTHSRSCRGREILIIGQSIPHARLHLKTLRELILRSNVAPIMRTQQTQSSLVFRDQVTKVGTIMLENPDDPNIPTTIYGLGPKEGSIWSYKTVKHVHISDIAATDQVSDYGPSINAALTRLSNTNGTMVLESPPRGPQGKLYDIWRNAVEKRPDDAGPDISFWPIKIPASKAVDAGLIQQEFLDNMRIQMGTAYNSYYEAEFTATEGNLFPLEQVERAVELGKTVDLHGAIGDYYRPRSMGIDPGWGSSQFAIVITQAKHNHIEVLFAKQFARQNPADMVRYAWELAHRFNVRKIYVDGANPGYIRDLKRRFGEPQNYEHEMAQIIGQQYEPAHYMKVVPVNFNKKGREMIAHCQYFMSRGELALPEEEFQDLVVQIRSAQDDGKGNLDKKTNTMDLFDGWRLSMLNYQVLPSHANIKGVSSPIAGGRV
jgi:hypothetical protein